MEENIDTSAKKSNNSMLLVGLIVIALIVGGVFILRGSNTSNTTTTNSESSTSVIENSEQTATVTGSEQGSMETGVKVIEVEGGGFYFKPNEIRVKKGEKVKIVLKSVDMMHDFVVDELDVRTEIAKSGETAEVEFTPSEVGEFEFYCSVGQHRANGMVGTLIVEE